MGNRAGNPKASSRLAVVLLAVSAMVGPGRAHAAGYASARFGGQHATAADVLPTAIYYNPAGLGLLDGQQLMLDAALAIRSSSYLRDPDSVSEATLTAAEDAGYSRQAAIDALTGESTLGNLVLLPFAGVSTDLGMPDSGLRLGAAFFVPFGGQSTWDEEPENADFPGASDGSARWYNIEGTIRSLAFSLGAAYRFERPRLSVGVSGTAYISEVSTVRARNANGGDGLVSSDGSILEGRSLLDVSGTDLGLGLGVLWEPVPERLWLGLSYQSQPGFGTQELSGTLDNTLGSGPPASPQDVVFTQQLPDIFRLGIRGRPAEQVELRLGADYTRWSQLEQMCLASSSVGNLATACATAADGSAVNPDAATPVVQVFQRDWEDTFGVVLSGSYFFGSSLEVYGGVGFDANAIPDATLDPALYDMQKMSLAAGGTYRFDEHVALTLTLTEVVYFERDTRGTAGNEALLQPSRQPVNAGVYQQNVFLIQPALQVSL
ncbi:MAG: outer membrane protein transport protein [Myxococcales bacterium]